MRESGNRPMLSQILDTAQDLFLRYGYQGLSMRQIAEAVGVTKPALYYYFQDKEQLFLAVIQKCLEGIERQIDQIEAEHEDARLRIRQLVKAMVEQPGQWRALLHLASQDNAGLSSAAQQRLREAYRTRFMDRLREILIAGMQNNELRRLDPQAATWALLGLLYPSLDPDQSEAASQRDRQVEDLLWIFLHGISQPGHF